MRVLSWFSTTPDPLEQAHPLWPAERIVFLNDVYFCARDVIRLLRHKADMACGMDFDRLKLQDMPIEASLPCLAVDVMWRDRTPAVLSCHVGGHADGQFPNEA